MKEKTKVTLKKIVLGIFMCLALVMLGMPAEEAMAATVTPTPQITTPVFDTNTSKLGSITIHKYEYNEDATNPPLPTGTGSDADISHVPTDDTTTDNVDEGAKALENVVFTIYQVQDATWLKQYYDGTSGVTRPTVDDYWDATNGLKVIVSNTYTVTTGADGVAYQGSLPLGLYLVVETSAPDKVTKKADPFLVSIPLTIENNKWLYDVHVFPKNGTSYGEIQLEKKGVSGTSTINLENVTYVLQKQDGSDWVNVTKNEETQAPLTLSTNAQGIIKVEGLSQGTYRFIETSIGTNYGYILDGQTAYVFTVGADKSISYTPPGGAVPTAGASVTIQINNYKPSVEKKVMPKVTPAGATQVTPAIDANYSVGDTIKYQATIYIPKNIASLSTFTLTDSPTHITDDITSISITSLTKNTDYVVTTNTNNTKGFVINFNTTADNVKACAGQTLTLEYTAKLDPGADMSSTGNKNTLSLEYTNNMAPVTPYPNVPTPTPDGKTTTTITDEAVVYTFELEVIKEDESNNKLEGAEFDLYGEYINGVTEASKKITTDAAKALGLPDATTKSYAKIGTGTSAGTTGKIAFSGLSNGTYYLVETKAPTGYNLLSEPVSFTLDFSYTTGQITPTATATQIYVKQIDSNKTILTKPTTTAKLTYETNTSGSATGKATITIVNRTGFTLPTTGGAGGFLFTIIGCGIMIVGFVIFRKTSAKKSDAA